jgi:DnaJ-class molecular chaperone
MNLKMAKDKLLSCCKECAGKGFIQGAMGRGACLFCHGRGHTNHEPRKHNINVLTVMKWCEDYIDGKKDGWYH